MDVFAVLAYRWGNPHDYGFLVGVFDKEADAFAAADSTYGERGGKFDCEVLRLPKNHAFDGFDVPLVVRALEEPRPVHREPDPLRDVVSVPKLLLAEVLDVSEADSPATESEYAWKLSELRRIAGLDEPDPLRDEPKRSGPTEALRPDEQNVVWQAIEQSGAHKS